MPPKNRFTREEIIEAAFEVAKEEGFSKITARSVASRLNLLVAPIYANFKAIDELVQAAVQRVLPCQKSCWRNKKEKIYLKISGKPAWPLPMITRYCSGNWFKNLIHT